MDTNRIKKFATEARNILKKGIAVKITSLGFDAKGHVQEQHKPQLMQGGSLWNGQLQTEGFYHRWMALYHRVEQKGIKEVYEEAAYTWFNRLMAIRILQKNGLCEGVMDYADEARTPRIVNEARTGNIPQMSEENRRHLMELLDDDTKVTEQFALLITTWCQQNSILSACFGGMADYTELLLPANILAEGGFVDMINHTEFITDEEYQSPELIGWLYQFYISERKDEVFAKKGKFEADEIPAATQIFTPNWIVKYMVQNTIGRIYLDNNPWTADEFKPKWKYLVEPSEPTSQENIYKYNELTDLKVADLACGSGHILNECFDLLYDLYISEGYSRREAIENIFQKNLTGVDLDTRAQQMATFALLLKASQKDSNFADAHVLPNVLNMPSPTEMTTEKLNKLCLRFVGEYENVVAKELAACIEDMRDAQTLGSIMKFELDDMRPMITSYYEEWKNDSNCPSDIKTLLPYVGVILALTEKYSALVMNPPYMGSGNMNSVLSKYVKDHYEDGKADLFSTFMILAIERLAKNGKYGMINLPSWLFLSTFERLRTNIIKQHHIDSLLHMGRGIFGIDWGSTAFIITKSKSNTDGSYFRLHQRNFQHIYYFHIEQLFLNALNNHSFKYNFDEYRDENGVSENISFESNDSGLQLFYYANQKNFEKIPGCPIGYWVSPKVQEVFTSNLALSAVCSPTQGLATADNARFLRLWHEVSQSRIGFGFDNAASAARSQKKWFPTTKGGPFRRWYGNMTYLVNWENDGEELTNFKGSVIRNRWRYFTKCGCSWSTIASGKPSFRYFDKSWLFETKGSVCFPINEEQNLKIMGYLNSPLVSSFLQTLTPTLDFHEGPMSKIPYKNIENKDIDNIVESNVHLSKLDWDAHETSWDFQENELVSLSKREGVSKKLAEIVEQYKEVWTERFMQLHTNEEELNRQFIEIYGLQDELTPDVPLDEITILQQGEITIVKEKEENV